eukprot:scaffold27860_cov53-Isochrysis_galbana.AAC.1
MKHSSSVQASPPPSLGQVGLRVCFPHPPSLTPPPPFRLGQVGLRGRVSDVLGLCQRDHHRGPGQEVLPSLRRVCKRGARLLGPVHPVHVHAQHAAAGERIPPPPPVYAPTSPPP